MTIPGLLRRSDTTLRSSARLAIATLIVGIASGLAGVLVATLLHLIQTFAFGFSWGSELEAADNPSAWGRVISITAVGVVAAFAWWALRRWGKPVVSVEKAADGARMPALVTPLNSAIQVIAVGFGASIGKEAAPREAGAWLSQLIARWASLSARQTRILIACGAGSALAAVYNVPLGGALFAVEILLGEITIATAVPALMTSAIATFVARIAVSQEPLYPAPHAVMSTSLLVWSLIAGPLLGFASVGFLGLADRAKKIAPKGAKILIVMPVIFFLVGIVSIWFPEVLGNGRAVGLAVMNTDIPGTASAALMPLALLLVFAVLKTATTVGTMGAGAVGGTLQPSIALGSSLGALLGGTWSLFWPGSNTVAFAIVGAAAVLAVTMRAPFTGLVLVVEFTGQGPAVLIPMLVAVAGSVAVDRMLRQRALKRE